MILSHIQESLKDITYIYLNLDLILKVLAIQVIK